jgi:hypothetical protein
LATADRAWRAYGVSAVDRAALAADLRVDLHAAAADGVGPRQLLGPDIAEFARRLADEAGLHREPPELGRLLGTALIGAALGGTLGAVLLRVLSPMFFRLQDGNLPVQVAVGVYYGMGAAAVVAGAVTTVLVRLSDLHRIRRTALYMSLLLPVAGLLITPVTMGFARTTDYSTAGPVVLAETAMVLGALAGATALARRWSLRDRAASHTTGVKTA